MLYLIHCTTTTVSYTVFGVKYYLGILRAVNNVRAPGHRKAGIIGLRLTKNEVVFEKACN
jgi:hypothetical protein